MASQIRRSFSRPGSGRDSEASFSGATQRQGRASFSRPGSGPDSSGPDSEASSFRATQRQHGTGRRRRKSGTSTVQDIASIVGFSHSRSRSRHKSPGATASPSADSSNPQLDTRIQGRGGRRDNKRHGHSPSGSHDDHQKDVVKEEVSVASHSHDDMSTRNHPQGQEQQQYDWWELCIRLVWTGVEASVRFVWAWLMALIQAHPGKMATVVLVLVAWSVFLPEGLKNLVTTCWAFCFWNVASLLGLSAMGRGGSGGLGVSSTSSTTMTVTVTDAVTVSTTLVVATGTMAQGRAGAPWPTCAAVTLAPLPGLDCASPTGLCSPSLFTRKAKEKNTGSLQENPVGLELQHLDQNFRLHVASQLTSFSANISAVLSRLPGPRRPPSSDEHYHDHPARRDDVYHKTIDTTTAASSAAAVDDLVSALETAEAGFALASNPHGDPTGALAKLKRRIGDLLSGHDGHHRNDAHHAAVLQDLQAALDRRQRVVRVLGDRCREAAAALGRPPPHGIRGLFRDAVAEEERIWGERPSVWRRAWIWTLTRPAAVMSATTNMLSSEEEESASKKAVASDVMRDWGDSLERADERVRVVQDWAWTAAREAWEFGREARRDWGMADDE